MQHVNQRWLQMYHYALLALDILILIFFGASLAGIDLNFSGLGISKLVAVVAGLHGLYTIFIYTFVAKSRPWFANTISAAILGILIAAALASSQHLTHISIIFIIFCFFFTMNGPFVPLTGVFVGWTLYIIELGSISDKDNPAVLTTLITASIAVIVGWLIFRRWYIDDVAHTNSRLSGKLKQEKDITNLLLNSITDGVMITDPNGTVTSMNDSAAAIIGWAKKDAVKLDFRSLIQSYTDSVKAGDDKENAIEACYRTGKSSQQISLLRTPDGRKIYVDILASPIIEAVKKEGTVETLASQGVIAILRNVDAQKREEQQRSEFISTASHEMRTPVAAIEGFIELALNPKVATVDEKARDYLKKATLATKHLSNLFQDLLTVSKSEDGRLANNPKLIDLTELLKDVVEQYTLIAQKKNLQLTLEISSNSDSKVVEPLMYVHADPERLHEVVSNLIENSIKYTSSGIITVGTSLKQTSVVIRVSDTGMGIAAEDIPHLFQKFYRTDNSQTREIGGTGLGLYICKQIVEMLSGKIWVESTVGAGSTFYVELPRISPDQVAALSAKNNPAPVVNRQV